ncbi:MAG: DUF5916 domain-containing protein [bacterium]|nr:DUF5916 domain-containing protein [bacterium]
MKRIVTLLFLAAGLCIPGNGWGQNGTGKVQHVVGDLVYVNGINGSAKMGSHLQVVNGSQYGAKLQVVKVLPRLVVGQVIEANGVPVERNNEVVPIAGNGQVRLDRVVYAARVEKGPKLDGKMDDAVWQQAPPVEGFVQRSPNYWMPPSERTVARIVYDNEKIYFGFECYTSDMETLVANNMQRDSRVFSDDHIQILLDPFNDRQNGVFFMVNPLGARNDRLLSSEGRTYNEDWNCIWEARTTRHEKGWTAEVAIPFDQLRFNASEEMEWGINLGRSIASRNEETAFMVGRRNASPRARYTMTDLGSLRGLKAVKRKRLVQVKPYVLPGTAKNFDAANPEEIGTFEAGADMRIGITSNLALDLSYNTDFAQVEADQEQVNLTQFSLFFPEKREFFLEGSSLFDFGEAAETRGSGTTPPTLLFYSRRIGLDGGRQVPIILGSKLTGKAGRTSIGVLNALTDRETFGTGIIPRNNFSVLRVKQDVLRRSNIGFIAVNKHTWAQGQTATNRAGGVDFSFSPSRELNIQGFYARTWDSNNPDNDNARFLRVNYSGTFVSARAIYLDVEDNFEPTAGFVNRRRGIRAFRRFDSRILFIPRPRSSEVRNLWIGPEYRIIVDGDNKVKFWRARWNWWTQFFSGDRIQVRMERTHDVIDRTFRPSRQHPEVFVPTGEYTFTTLTVGMRTDSSRPLELDVAFDGGTYYNGERYRACIESAYRPSGRFSIETIVDANWIWLPQGGNLNIQTLSTRMLYSFTTDFFVKVFAQMNTDSELVGANFLLNYRFRPGSDLFLVYDHGFDSADGLNQTSRSLLLKLSYLIGL